MRAVQAFRQTCSRRTGQGEGLGSGSHGVVLVTGGTGLQAQGVGRELPGEVRGRG